MTTMTQEITKAIIFSDQSKADSIIYRHSDKLERLQKQVDLLKAAGLKLKTVRFFDLMNGGRSLQDYAAKLAKEESERLSGVLINQQRIEKETFQALERVINLAKTEFGNILVLSGSSPCEVAAYQVLDGVFSLSQAWIKEVGDRFTVYSTSEREEALKLANDLKASIEAINEFVKSNKYFNSGFGLTSNGKRSLCEMNGNLDFFINKNELQYI